MYYYCNLSASLKGFQHKKNFKHGGAVKIGFTHIVDMRKDKMVCFKYFMQSLVDVKDLITISRYLKTI